MIPEADSKETFENALADDEVTQLKLAGDIQLSGTESINHELELDLNGHEITTSQNSGYMFNVGEGGKLTLKNGDITVRSRIGVAQNGGEIVIDSGDYSSARDVAFAAIDGGKVTFNDGTITAQEGGIIAPSANGEIEVNGGTIEVLDNFALATNGNPGNNGNVITVNGGQLIGNIQSSGYEAIGVYIANQDTFVMNDGEIVAYGGTGICMRGGNVTINGGSITATSVNKNGDYVADGKVGDDSTVLTGVSAIVYHKSAKYQNEGMSLTINGGTITGVDKSIDVIGDEEPNITINGGGLVPGYPLT